MLLSFSLALIPSTQSAHCAHCIASESWHTQHCRRLQVQTQKREELVMRVAALSTAIVKRNARVVIPHHARVGAGQRELE
jgi:hypothetical protein